MFWGVLNNVWEYKGVLRPKSWRTAELHLLNPLLHVCSTVWYSQIWLLPCLFQSLQIQWASPYWASGHHSALFLTILLKTLPRRQGRPERSAFMCLPFLLPPWSSSISFTGLASCAQPWSLATLADLTTSPCPRRSHLFAAAISISGDESPVFSPDLTPRHWPWILARLLDHVYWTFLSTYGSARPDGTQPAPSSVFPWPFFLLVGQPGSLEMILGPSLS